MFKFEWPWERKKRLAEEARVAREREARLEMDRNRARTERLLRSIHSVPLTRSAASKFTPAAKAEESRRVRELRERLEEESRQRRLREEEDRRRRESNDGDFLTSMVVAQATNSTLTGYAVGGSLTGAMLGESLSHRTPESPKEEPWHGSGGGSSGAGASASWEPREETRTPDPEPEPSRYESSSSSYDSGSSSSFSTE